MKVGGKPRRASREALVNWSDVAAALKHRPLEDVLLPEFTGTKRVLSILPTVNQGQVRALRELGGVVVASARNTRSSIAGGQRVGDVWLRWDPHAEPASRYSARYLQRD